ncbi:MAG: ABC transporter permease [Proteobacteria bacterium]|nr:ABC transporter permease [Pseudomonadota bacterium]
MRQLEILAMLAWRNLWRNHRRTIIMISAITVGVWAMIFMTALMRGMVNDMLRSGIQALPGHVQIHHPGFRDDPSVNNLIPASGTALDEIFGDNGFEPWASRVKVPAVITSERESRGVTLFGIDPATEAQITFVADDIAEGRYLEDEADSGIVIGRKLADKLDTRLGKRVVLMSQDPDNEIADRGFRIVGIFDSDPDSLEETFVFAGRATIQKMLGIGDRVTEVVFLAADHQNIEPLYKRVSELAGPDVVVEPWYELDRYLSTMLNIMDGFVLVWIVVVFLALSFGLVNTLVMAVFERIREIGLMLALGMRPANILGQIVVESLLLLVIGLALGNAFAWMTVVPLKDGIDISAVAQGMEMMGASSVLYPDLQIRDVIMANIVVLALGFLASLSPAWRASRYQPVEAITKV